MPQKSIHTRILSSLLISVLLFVAAASALHPALAASAFRPRAQRAPSAATAWTPQEPGYRVIIDATQPEGLYMMDYTALSNAGLPVDTLDPRTFRMFWRGQEIAIHVLGEADGSFDPGDKVLFYGRNLDDLFYDGLYFNNDYTGDAVFWLSYGGPNGKRMTIVNGAPASAQAQIFPHKEHLEKNYAYLPKNPLVEGEDHWYWQKIEAYGSGSASRDYSFTAHNIATDNVTGTLTVKLVSTIGDGKVHELTLLVNGNQVYHNKGDWVDDTLFEATAQVPQSYFQEGTNTITVKITNDPNSGGSIDQVYTNWLEVAYYDTFVAENDALISVNEAATLQQYAISGFNSSDIIPYDVSDLTDVRIIDQGQVTGAGPYTINFDSDAARLLTVSPNAWLTPARIEAVTYPTSTYAPSDLLDASLTADYILITHRDFWTQAEQLAQHRSAEYDVALVDVQRIYDQFNGGMMSAEAIRDFLSYAYFNWAVRPQYVLLMGDGTYDMRNYGGNSFPTYIPVFLKIVGSVTGETASENRFVTLEDDPTYGDLMPDMYLGRFPVNSAQEAQDLVDKTIGYENASCDPMPTDVLFVADDEDSNLYWDLSDELADGYDDPPTNTVKYLPAPYTPVKKYLGKDCNYAPDGDAASGEECRQQITDQINMTNTLLVSYAGHSTKNYWAVEQVWTENMVVNDFTNSDFCKMPVTLNQGCDEGYFHDPTDAAVSEVGVRKAGSGLIGAITPSYYGLPYGHQYLAKGVFLALFNDGVQQAGRALVEGKKYAFDRGGYTKEIDGYLFLGDPALKIKTSPASTLGAVNSSIAKSGSTVQISWDAVTGATQYDIYRAVDDPYFTPVDPPYATDVTSPWTDPDPNALGDPAQNYFYVVRARDNNGNTSDGVHHGEFDFALTPGQ